MAEAKQYNVVFVLGIPACGKGTMCQMASERLRGWDTISAGQVLRDERTNYPDSEESKTIAARIDKGECVPAYITVRLMRKAMEKSKKKNFLIDGFPRTQDNVDTWAKEMTETCYTCGLMVMELDEAVAMERLKGRTEARTDDTEELLKKRFNQHNSEVVPIIKMYEANPDLLVQKIDASPTKEKVYTAVKGAILNWEAKIPRKKKAAKFTDIGEIDPNLDRINVIGKVLNSIPNSEKPEKSGVMQVTIGDSTGIVSCNLRGEELNTAKHGVVVRMQNVRVSMLKSHNIRITLDQWSVVKEHDDQTAIKEVNEEKNVSGIEYEPYDSEDDEEEYEEEDAKEGQVTKDTLEFRKRVDESKGKGKKGKKGKGKGKDSKGKGKKGKGKDLKGKGKGWGKDWSDSYDSYKGSYGKDYDKGKGKGKKGKGKGKGKESKGKGKGKWVWASW